MASSVLLAKVEWGPKTLEGCRKYGCVYFHAIGGAAQVLAEKIKSVDDVHLKEKFGSPEAVWELTVEDFPVVVTMDSHGGSLHSVVEGESEKALANELGKKKTKAKKK